jgi:hypothetical protein
MEAGSPGEASLDIELHHFFILTEPDAPRADLLLAAGIIEGASNDHPGQGTANRRFFFPNAMLEMIFIRDADEARNGAGKRLRIIDRLEADGASPLGLIVRPLGETPDIPFAAWNYHADYLPAGKHFLVGDNSDLLEEPLCVCSPTGLPMTDPPADTINQELVLTGLVLSVPVEKPSETLVAFAASGPIKLKSGKPHHMELTFNDSREGLFHDFQPDLPLSVRW